MTITKELIDKIISGQNSEANDEVNEILYAKAIEQLDAYKQEVASQLMNPVANSEEPQEDEPEQ
jgi:proteasome lid subunit RPN8/RPN11